MRTPFKLRPAFKDYLWGGQRLRTVFGKQTDLSPLCLLYTSPVWYNSFQREERPDPEGAGLFF